MRALVLAALLASLLAPAAFAQNASYDYNRSLNGSPEESVPPSSGGSLLSSTALAAILVVVVGGLLSYVFWWRGGAMHDEGLYRHGRLRP